MKKTYLSFLLCFTIICGFAQDIITDYKGETLFNVPVTTIQPQISSNNVGLTVPISQFGRKLFYVSDNAGNHIYTMAKSQVIFINGNIVNNSDPTLIFNSKTDYSPSLEIGTSIGFDSLINPSAKRGFYFTFTGSVFASYQNFNYYDTIHQVFSNAKTNRVSPGIKLAWSMLRGTSFAFSFSASWQYSINTDLLTSYQKRPNTFYYDANVSTNGVTDGYLAPVLPSNNFRFSFSMPNFWISPASNTKLPFAIVPYWAGTYANGQDPINNAGLIVSFLGSRFHRFDRTGALGFDPTVRYSFVQAFSVGYNIISPGNASARYIFATGTFSLAALKHRPTTSTTLKGTMIQ